MSDQDETPQPHLSDSSEPSHPPRLKSRLKRLLRWLLFTCVIGGLLGLCVTIAVWSYYSRDLPDFNSLEEYKPFQLTRVLDREGKYLGRLSQIRRTVVLLDDISPLMIQALLSAEDADFYQHGGIDYKGILRAIYNSVRAGRLKGSGSTITQQMVKNILLTHEKTLERKLKELILTRRIEGRFSKRDILSMYLNTIYFGHSRYGIEEAARYYFGISASELDLVQSATLAGLIQSPENHSPRRHMEASKRRRSYVLREMEQNGYISAEERERATNAELTLKPPPDISVETGQWMVREVKQLLRKQYDSEALKVGGFTVTSTLNLTLQRSAQRALQEGIRDLIHRQRLDRPKRSLKPDEYTAWLRAASARHANTLPATGVQTRGLVTEVDSRGVVKLSFGDAPSSIVTLDQNTVSRLKRAPRVGDIYDVYLKRAKRGDGVSAYMKLPQAALVALDPHTREVLVMVGGYSFSESSYNRVTQAHLQPGSVFKPFVYGAAIESRRFTLTSVLLDSPETVFLGGGQMWTPKNYNGKFVGPVMLRDALARSINSVAVRLADSVGLERVKAFARRVGLRDVKLSDSLTLALGSSEVSLLEIVNAYATFASGGYNDPIMIKRVEINPTSVLHGRRHSLKWPPPPALTPALSEPVSWLIQRMLRRVVTHGSGRKLKRYREGQVIGKTGTTSENRDAWFVGSLPNLTFGVWVGYDLPRSLGKREGGSKSAAPIILSFLKESQWSAGRWADAPDGVVKANVDERTGSLAGAGSSGAVSGHFLTGTVPKARKQSSRQLLGGDL